VGVFALIPSASLTMFLSLGNRIFLANKTLNVDLSDHGNPTPGTPVELWGEWEGENQLWDFVPA
jgi:hypothetical protein